MADFTFDVDQNLGAVVLPNYKVFCNWSPKTPIADAYKVTRDVCGHKFSTICGFTFKSNLDAPYFILHPELKLSLSKGINDTAFHPTFQVVYVPKSRSTHARNDKALSGWYLWQHLAVDNKQIMSNRDLFAYYGFDVSKFFQSDVFKKYLPMFKKQVQAAYDTTVKEFIDSFGIGEQHGYTQRDCMFFSKCVVDSMQKIDDVLKTNWERPEEMKAKLAYNADDTYSLNAKNNHNLDQTSGVNPTGDAVAEEAESQDVVKEAEEDASRRFEITEADTEQQKSEKLWGKAKAMLQKALAGYNDIAEYCKLIAEAYDFDSTFVQNDDPQMAETKADVDRAAKALDDLRKALHFD